LLSDRSLSGWKRWSGSLLSPSKQDEITTSLGLPLLRNLSFRFPFIDSGTSDRQNIHACVLSLLPSAIESSFPPLFLFLDSQEGSLSLPDPSPGPSGSENWDSSFEIDVLLEEWPTTAGGESAETGTSVNRPESGRVPPATHVAPRGDEAGPSNQPPQGVPYPYHPEQVIGGDSVLSIERRLLSGQTTPSPLDIYLARIDAEDLFEAKVKILQRMAELDPTGDWERRGARALSEDRHGGRVLRKATFPFFRSGSGRKRVRGVRKIKG